MFSESLVGLTARWSIPPPPRYDCFSRRMQYALLSRVASRKLGEQPRDRLAARGHRRGRAARGHPAQLSDV
jgi:hypothetical protein